MKKPLPLSSVQIYFANSLLSSLEDTDGGGDGKINTNYNSYISGNDHR